MADEINENKINEDAGPGLSTFGGPGQGTTYAYPRGKIGAFFAKFFATKAVPYLQNQDDLAGDTLINPEQSAKPARWSSNHQKLPFLPEIEINRKRRYG